MRTFSGADEFEALKKTVVDSYTKLFPVKKGQASDSNAPSMHLKKIWVEDDGLDPQDYPAQKKARLAGNTWGAPVYADIELKDATGKVIDRMEKIRLATIPRLTPRGSYIVSGNEYQVSNQLRKKPGVYVHRKQSGDEYKLDVSLKDADKMKRFTVEYDPATAKFTANFGQSVRPLYPFLHALGISDEQLRKSWGADVLAVNKVDPAKHLPKIANSFARITTDNKQTAVEAIQSYAKKLTVDPHTTALTVGKPYTNLHPEMLLAATEKLKKTYSEQALPDDPENLLFKEVLSTEDMLQDKLNSEKQVSAFKDILSRNLGRRSKIKEIINFKKLSAPVETFFTHDDRSSTTEQYNPVNMIAEKHKLTFMGTGGITNTHAITNDIREVHPSHVGFIDPVHTPEGEKVGVTLHLTAGAIKDGRGIRTHAINTKTGKTELLSPLELFKKVVAFPDEGALRDGKVHFSSKKVRAQKEGALGEYKPSEVEYILPSAPTLFSHSTNLVPFLQSNQGNRAMMAAKMLGQALPLVNREAPNVQTALPGGTTFHDAIGREFSVHAKEDGVVKEITKDHITIGKTKIPLYHDFPLNQKTFLTHTPTVKVGDRVKKGQLIADSNFTKGGTLALGKNLKVAYLPYPGLTFEDGIVITESAAKKLSSQHIYKHSFDVESGNREVSLKKFVAHYPNKIAVAKRENYDEDGVVKKGALVKPGDILITGMKYDLHSPENMTLRRINKAIAKPWSDASVPYTGEFEGVVSDVVKRANRVDVYVKTVEPAKESDKLSGVHGNKGVITKVLPDNEAPRTKDGLVPDVFLNPHGVIGRVNLGQIYESAAGKIAEKTGKPYIVKNFSGDRVNEKVLADLETHGLQDTEEMFLPDGRAIGKVHVGSPYILRLAKTGKTGFSARTPGAGYDMNLQPTKGGEEGTKSMDLLAYYSMLSHGAKHNLADVHQKSEKNDEYWHAVETGRPIPTPKPTFAFQKFINLLKGAGINTVQSGDAVHLAPLTDDAVRRMSNGAIKEHNFFYGKNGKEISGGYFDATLTGGRNGSKFTHIELKEPVPNPVFEKAIQSVLELKKAEFDALLKGEKSVNVSGKVHTGGHAIKALLDQVNVDSLIAATQEQIKSSNSPAKTDRLNKKLRYLSALKTLNVKPSDAYTRTLVPVIPPVHRPIIDMPGLGLNVAPANYLYQRTGILNESMGFPVMNLLPEDEKKEIREDLYKSTRAIAGLEPVTVRGKDHPIEGFISQITGSQPKEGFFLSKVINKRQDLVGRGVITAAPDLHVDELGIPEKMAWKVFHPFVIREFGMAGVAADVARKEIEAKTPRARTFLEAAMNKRTVLMNRAPSLHKFSIMAFKPKLSNSLAVRVPPLVLKGFGGDFDGDAVTIHVPTSHQAVQESYKMLPSNNLFKPGTGELMMTPSQESTIGAYFLSQTESGRKLINSVLPQRFHIHSVLDQHAAKALYMRMAKEDPKNYADYVLKLKNLGDKHAYETGFSIGVKDTILNTKRRDAIFAHTDAQVDKIKRTKKPGPERDAEVAKLYQEAAKRAYEELEPELKKSGNNFYHMVRSGARGKPEQLQQLIVAPGIVEDAKQRPVPVPLKTSYAEGVKTSDYFVASYGVRKGMLDKSLQTSQPGALNKDIMANTIDNIITKDDCGTQNGIALPVDSTELSDRHLAKDQHGHKRNSLVTPQVISDLKRKGAKNVLVRTPLRCIAPKGTCGYCYGLDEHGHIPQVGENIGAKAGQTMSEPMTQMVLRTFHTGGMAGTAPTIGGFQRIRQLLSMPSSHLAGQAVLATTEGKVTKIAPAPGGGHRVFVGEVAHTVPPTRTLNIKVGDRVSAGDALTQGTIKPQDILKFKGMESAQNYLVDELHKSYSDAKTPVQRKVFETVVRSIGNLTKVVSTPKDSEYRPGDVIPFTTAQHHNLSRKKTLPVGETVGYHLHKAVGRLPEQHEITDKDISYLKAMGYNTLEVVKAPIVHRPIIKNIERLSGQKKNWMAQLGYRYISETLTDGAAEAWKTHLSGEHPIPAYAYGADFGKKKEHY